MLNKEEYLTSSQAASLLNISSGKVVYNAKKGEYPGAFQDIKTRVFLIPKALMPEHKKDETDEKLAIMFYQFVSKDILTDKKRKNIFLRN